MNQKENAAPTAPTAGNGKDEQTILTGFKLTKDFITEFVAPQGTIASILQRGREHALTTREIARITGLSLRRVTLKICAERRGGSPILSDNRHGFWLAENEEELIDCVHRLHARAAQIHKTANAMEKRYG